MRLPSYGRLPRRRVKTLWLSPLPFPILCRNRRTFPAFRGFRLPGPRLFPDPGIRFFSHRPCRTSYQGMVHRIRRRPHLFRKPRMPRIYRDTSRRAGRSRLRLPRQIRNHFPLQQRSRPYRHLPRMFLRFRCGLRHRFRLPYTDRGMFQSCRRYRTRFPVPNPFATTWPLNRPAPLSALRQTSCRRHRHLPLLLRFLRRPRRSWHRPWPLLPLPRAVTRKRHSSVSRAYPFRAHRRDPRTGGCMIAARRRFVT